MIKGRYKVKVVVTKQEGHCELGHKVGDSWIFDEGKTPAGLCTFALGSFLSRLHILEFGGALPWRENPDSIRAACPDGPNPVWFELYRIREDKT